MRIKKLLCLNMGLKMKIELNDIKKAQDCNLETIANEALYKLCKEHPYHNKKSEIVSKIWIIGRAYAAAVERRRINREISNDEFYDKVVGEGLLKHGKEIDALISSLNHYPEVTMENIESILELHALLTNVLKSLTGQYKRSLVSKYLHFHLPNLFYIYDSRAAKEINALSKTYNKEESTLDFNCLKKGYDKDYTKFFAKMYAANHKIKDEFSVWLTPRELDNLLLCS